jgi:hypothetical protein
LLPLPENKEIALKNWGLRTLLSKNFRSFADVFKDPIQKIQNFSRKQETTTPIITQHDTANLNPRKDSRSS